MESCQSDMKPRGDIREGENRPSPSVWGIRLDPICDESPIGPFATAIAF